MDAAEFKQQFLPFYDKLYRVAYVLTGNEDDAKDVVQDTYLKLWEKRDSLAHIDNPQHYCLTIVRNLCIDRHRAPLIKAVDTKPEELLLAGSDSSSSHIECSEVSHMLEKCLARLPAQQQLVIKLRDINGCSLQEIEKATGHSPGNVRVLLSRARNSLRNQLQTFLKS